MKTPLELWVCQEVIYVNFDFFSQHLKTELTTTKKTQNSDTEQKECYKPTSYCDPNTGFDQRFGSFWERLEDQESLARRQK